MLKHPLVTHVAAALVASVATLAILIARGGPATAEAPAPVVLPTGSGGYEVAGQRVGRPDAPLTIEVWADYQCPYCGLFTHALEPMLLREYVATGKAVLHFRDYAFLGQESTDAAVAARCAEREGAYWRYHDLLYASQSGENQGAFAPERLAKLAEFTGIDVTAFGACVADPAVAAEVAAETREGGKLGVESTPTVRIIGKAGVKTVKGVAPLAQLTEAIDGVARGLVDPADGTGGTGNGPASSGAPASTTP